MAISLIMVIGVFLARWSVPALILGTSSIRADVRRAPHLIIWAILAGCLWAVANTMTIFAIRDVGLRDRKSTRLNSSHSQISYAVFCLKKKKKKLSVEHTTKLSYLVDRNYNSSCSLVLMYNCIGRRAVRAHTLDVYRALGCVTCVCHFS